MQVYTDYLQIVAHRVCPYTSSVMFFSGGLILKSHSTSRARLSGFFFSISRNNCMTEASGFAYPLRNGFNRNSPPYHLDMDEEGGRRQTGAVCF